MGLLESIFSCVFGDADPNANLDVQRWERVGKRGQVAWFEMVSLHAKSPSDCVHQPRPSIPRQIGRYIQEHGGVVTAEELSPFLDGQRPSGTETAGVNEAFVLPVLQRFRGSPVVSKTGTIVYHFPELQQTASLLKRVSVC